ncbi:MAG: hypothetical protein JZD40_02360 [Sulfolobus sp.]|nr:hypothetical protein [Sulfolobus sp.]
MKKTIIIGIIAVVLIGIGIFLLIRPQQSFQINQVVFPTQAQISSTLGEGWNITGLQEYSNSSFISQQYKGTLALYQEFVQNGNQTITISVFKVNSTSSSSVKGIKVGNYIVSANISGNTTKFNLEQVENLEVQTLKSQKGLTPSLYPTLYNSTATEILSFGNHTSENYTIYYETILYNDSYTAVYLLKASPNFNITTVYNDLLTSATNTSKNVTRGNFNGFKYFNLSVISYYGEIYYFAGTNGEYLLYIETQSPQAFTVFKVITGRL